MSLYVTRKPLRVGTAVLQPGDRLPEEAATWKALRRLLDQNLVAWTPEGEDDVHPLVAARRVEPLDEKPSEEFFGDSAYNPGAYNVDEVVAYVEANPESAEAVLAAEQEGKSRSTLITAIEDLLQAVESEEDAEEGEEEE